ncbi:hypothetical protein COCSADRAFT_172763 [Bipolaris sorokiniana ND90Pr]|uniref:N-acetyltransferase domain-containing protein n=1 Tax=Cochliobolus sativus (strain ND90Pr / ATCC 201652) TaxID=665912 RepID=M2SZA4_COCSN|nr:uncharacterized protein COCSADRAFT_172763 [Bipolaris sorokiniana ND90Pr]EMD62286.1 hypothetical protein COCSADRAFT_172763 [Bipolaris sorokiniana ND90Pr]
MSSDKASLRYAHREDIPTILALIRELADYENASFARTLLITEPDGTVAGMAVYFFNFSTWTGVPGIYLEDLFVKEAYRKKGYGKRLLKELAALVLEAGGKRLEWSCLDWNEPSLNFYQSEVIGAKRKNEWVGLRVEGDALAKLANS